MLEKTYDSAAVEPKIAKAWDEANAFRAGANAKPGAGYRGKPKSARIRSGL